MNAVYTVSTVSPNGAVGAFHWVAARSETEAARLMQNHEAFGRDGYAVGNAYLVGDLAADHAAKYSEAAYLGSLDDQYATLEGVLA